MTWPLEDWRSREGLVKGEYASDVEFLRWHPGRTRHAVAIDLGEGLGTRAHIFNKYFMDTNRINTNEGYLNFGWAAPIFTESDWSTMKHHTKKMHL